MRQSWRRALIVVTLFAAFFIVESTFSYTRKSATWDEPIHVANGYFSLIRGDYRFDPEHPPLARMLAALPPSLMPRVSGDLAVMDRSSPDTWAIVALYDQAHRFLYVENDADRLLYAARFMMVLLGVGLGLMLFGWTWQWLGFVPAVAALMMMALEPNLVAHFSIVATDAPVTCLVFSSVYFLWRTIERQSIVNAGGLAWCTSLALVTKYSAVLLYPAIGVLLLFAVFPLRRLRPATAAALFALILVTGYVTVWAVYGFRYAPSHDPNWLYHFHDSPYVIERVPALARLVGWVDRHQLLPNVFSEGFLLAQAKAQVRTAFLAGTIRDTGWWYFFPAAVALKSPIALLLLAGGGLGLLLLRHRQPMTAFIVVPIAAFLIPAMVSHINIGLRHVLVIYPFLIMAAAFAVRELLTLRAGPAGLALLGLLWVGEFSRAYPHPLAFFNLLAGGPGNGARYLVDSNLDWGQDLKTLKTWMREHEVARVNLAYFGTADPRYYGIDCTFLPGSPSFVPPELFKDPQFPGYVVVSATHLAGAAFDEAHRDYYRPLQALTPVAVLGYSMNVYWVERPWWPAARDRGVP